MVRISRREILHPVLRCAARHRLRGRPAAAARDPRGL